MEIDRTLYLFLNSFAEKNFYLDFFFYFFASLLPYLIIIFFGYFLIRNWKKNIIFVVEVFFTAFFAKYALVELLRYLFPRSRPFLVLEEAKLLLPYKESMSFPSVHTAFLFAIATIVYFYNKKAGYFLFALSFLGAIGRVYLGIHWPADVFAGALVGVLSALIISEVFNLIKKRLDNPNRLKSSKKKR